MKKVFLLVVVFIITLITVNAQRSCEDKKFNSVGSALRERTPYSPIIQSTQANCGYKISFNGYDAETGSIYCDVKFTNLEGKEETWNGTGDMATIKPKAGTTLYVRFWNSTTIQGALVEYEICKISL